ncbi:C-C chemokine receptor-like 2 isoform 1 [Daubentonia madagascariensis]|uniref:C-C chemokine receptor-like 2 isoform 1 n=2 Tax=Daubentonia madagascariensis TaxID=31869 RepID=A0ABD2F4J5_DAUMA
MANYTSAPEEEYDVLIEGDLKDNEAEQCDRYDAQVLSAQLVPQICSLVFLAGLLGNIVVVLILVKYKGLKHVENIYFLNLAVSNLCFLLTLPFWAYTASHGGSLGDAMCKFLVGLCSAGLYGEALFNVLLTVQRYLVFLHVQRFSWATRTTPCGIITSVLAWVIVVILAILPECMFYKPQMEGQVYTCTFSRPPFLPMDETFQKHFLTLMMNILVLAFPLFILIFSYVQMRKTLRFRERKYDLFKLVFAIVVVFLLIWAPYNVAVFLSAFKEHFSLHDCKSNYDLDRSVQITKIIATTHCCVNPLLYVFLDKAFRKYLHRLFHLHNSTPLQPSEESAQGASRGEHVRSTQV